MGSGESRYLWGARIVVGLAVAVVVLAAGPTPQRNHSFDIPAAGRTVCTDGAVYVGETIGPSSLNILQTSEVWNDAGTMLLATGDSHTFTAVGETFTFTVMGSFTAGATVTLSVTNSPGTLGGTEGDAATETVGDCSIAAVPSLPAWGLLLLALALVAAWASFGRRAGSRSAWPTAAG